MSIASLHAASAAARCGEETAIATLGSPISTRPTRWWIATVEQVVPLGELARELGHRLLGHPLVRLVLEVEHVPVARAVADGAEEGRDRAGLVALHLAHDGVERERLGA